jgi:hypothetical protein
MAEPRPRRPRRRRPEPEDRTPERVLAVAGVAGLLLVFVISVVLIGGAGGSDDADGESASATVTATPTPTPTAEPKPTPVPLTAAERAERQAAADIVASRGFEVVRLRDYDPRDTLRVLIGRSSSGGEMAFFFVRGDYIGNDSTETSAQLRVRRTTDVAATLAYGIFQPGDAPDKPTGTPVRVRFQWDGVRIAPEAEVPAPELRAPRQTG